MRWLCRIAPTLQVVPTKNVIDFVSRDPKIREEVSCTFTARTLCASTSCLYVVLMLYVQLRISRPPPPPPPLPVLCTPHWEAAEQANPVLTCIIQVVCNLNSVSSRFPLYKSSVGNWSGCTMLESGLALTFCCLAALPQASFHLLTCL